MNNYTIIDTNSGFVWWCGTATDSETACYAADDECKGRDEDGYYEMCAEEVRDSRGIYDVRIAPPGYTVDDGQDPDAIAAVEAMPRAGLYAWYTN